ncbi:hypothetical protein ABTM06_20085, partial [Acinetobacter baumannii]
VLAVISLEQMQPAEAIVGYHDSVRNIPNLKSKRTTSFSLLNRPKHGQQSAHFVDKVDVFVVVAREYLASGLLPLVNARRCQLEYH